VTNAKRAVDAREKNVQVRLTVEEHFQLMQMARAEETSAGAIIRKLLKAAGYL
jgi:hypothetical protein